MEVIKLSAPKKLHTYPVEFKLKVIEFTKTASKHKTARTFNIDRRRVIGWCRQELKLREALLLSRKRVPGGGDKPKWVEIDKQLYDWLMEERARGINVTSKAVQQKALELHTLYGNEKFKASSGWLRRWRKRHNVNFLYRASVTISGKDNDILLETMGSYHRRISRLRMQHQYDLSLIGSVSEITIWYNRLEETKVSEGIKKDDREAMNYQLGLAPTQENGENSVQSSNKEKEMFQIDSEKRTETILHNKLEETKLPAALAQEKDENSVPSSNKESGMLKNGSQKQTEQESNLIGPISKSLDKNRLSVILGALAGGVKFPPIVIFKGGVVPSNDDIPFGLYVRITESGWSDEEELLWWLKTIWTSDLFQDTRRLIICDSFRGNAMDKVEDALQHIYNTDLVIIPDGCTGILRPAEMSWNSVFKRLFHEHYKSWLNSSGSETRVNNNSEEPSRQLLLKWVKEAWANVSPKTIRSSFKWCGIKDVHTSDYNRDDTNSVDIDYDNLSEGSGCDSEVDNKPILSFPDLIKSTPLFEALPIKMELRENIGLESVNIC